MQTGDRQSDCVGLVLDRRRFLIAGAAATVAAVAGCSSDDSSGSSSTDATGTTSGTAAESTADAVPTDTVPSGMDEPAVALSAAAAALVAPGTAGLIDEDIWQTRIDESLEFATTAEHSSKPAGINAYLGRAHRDPEFKWPIENVTVESLQAVFAQIDAWEDTRDFRFMDLHWMLVLGQGDTPATQLSPEVIAAIDERMLANRYRYDDPLPADRIDNLWYWSENHRIINLAIEYLAGQHYPDATFMNYTGTSISDANANDIALACLADHLGRHDVADGHYSDAIALADRARAIPYGAHYRYEWARALVDRGDTEHAKPMLAEVADIAKGRDMHGPDGYVTWSATLLDRIS